MGVFLLFILVGVLHHVVQHWIERPRERERMSPKKRAYYIYISLSCNALVAVGLLHLAMQQRGCARVAVE